MKTADGVLWCVFIIGLIIAFLAWRFDRHSTMIERFEVDIRSLTLKAGDAAPTTSELKNHYKALLLYGDDKFRNGTNTDNDKDQGTRKAACLISSLGSILYDRPALRDDFIVDDFLGNWPTWLPPLNTTIKEPVPTYEAAAGARMKILAYIQKNFGSSDPVNEDTGSTMRNLYTDIGKRFFFMADEPVTLREDLLTKSITNNITAC